MKTTLTLSTACLFAAAFLGCSTEDQAKQKPEARAFPAHSLKVLEMKIDTTPEMERSNGGAEPVSLAPIAGLTALQNQLWVQIQNNRVNSNTLIDAFIEVHQKDYNAAMADPEDPSPGLPMSPAEMRVKIASLAMSANLKQDNPNKLKAAVEDKLEAELGEIQYNRGHASLYSLFEQNRMQCFSGTSFFEVVRQLRHPDLKKEDGAVVIFTDGHVMPGFIRRHGFSDQFDLFGIETTVRGQGLVLFGNTQQLENVRVIEAVFFMAIEIFEDKLLNPKEVLQNALSYTASRYAIPYKIMEQTLATPAVSYSSDESESSVAGKLSTNLEDRVNQSLFAFGTSQDVPFGDLNRERKDEVPMPTPTAGGKNLAKGYAHDFGRDGEVLVDPLGVGVEMVPPDGGPAPEVTTQLQRQFSQMDFDPALPAPAPTAGLDESTAEVLKIGFSPAVHDRLAELRSDLSEVSNNDLGLFITDGHLFVLHLPSQRGGDGSTPIGIFKIESEGVTAPVEMSSDRLETWVQSSNLVCFGTLPLPNSPLRPDTEQIGFWFDVNSTVFSTLAAVELNSRAGSFFCHDKTSNVHRAPVPMALFEEPSAADISRILGPNFVVQTVEAAIGTQGEQQPDSLGRMQRVAP